jgi:hypothetical protein
VKESDADLINVGSAPGAISNLVIRAAAAPAQSLSACCAFRAKPTFDDGLLTAFRAVFAKRTILLVQLSLAAWADQLRQPNERGDDSAHDADYESGESVALVFWKPQERPKRDCH